MTALGTDSDSPGGAKRHTRHSETIHNYCQYLSSAAARWETITRILSAA
jgi:hypothetical protein